MRQEAYAIDSLFSTCRENTLNDFYLVASLRNNHDLAQTNRDVFQITLHLCLAVCTRACCLSCFYSTNIINSNQIIETFKVQPPSFRQWVTKGISIKVKRESSLLNFPVLLRYLAESNCPTRFCRPLPNRSAKVPFC